MVVAGVVFETASGAGPRVAARLAREPGVELAGGDGRCRIAAVCQARDGAELEALARRLLSEDQEILGIYPTFVGRDEEG
jgi:hypothetical protein